MFRWNCAALPAGLWRASGWGTLFRHLVLVNEAFLKLVDIRRIQWQNRAHFYAMSARLMRQILVDFARSKKKQKRGGGAMRVTLDENLDVIAHRTRDLVALDDALNALAAETSPVLASARSSSCASLEGSPKKRLPKRFTFPPTPYSSPSRKFAQVWLHRELTRGPFEGSPATGPTQTPLKTRDKKFP